VSPSSTPNANACASDRPARRLTADPLPAGHVQLWRMDTPVVQGQQDQLASLLSPQEHARAQGLALPAQRQRFITRRGMLRTILGHYLQIPASDVELVYGPQGKPMLCSTTHAGRLIHFNFTHSRELAILALASDEEVGIDVEAIDPQRSIEGIARRYFHEKEWQCIRTMDQTCQARAFFDTWACKEALVKAQGGGIMAGLQSFIIHGVSDQPGLREVTCPQGNPMPWTLHTLQVHDQNHHPFMTAIARRGSQWSFSTHLADATQLL
jgi:4'-phosphopantetheinyl transferase